MTDKERIAALREILGALQSCIEYAGLDDPNWDNLTALAFAARCGLVDRTAQEALSPTPEPRMLSELRAAREVLWKIKERNIPGYDTDPLGMGVIDPDYRMSRDALTRLDAFLNAFLKDDLRESGIEELTKLRSQLSDAREVIHMFEIMCKYINCDCGYKDELKQLCDVCKTLQSTSEKRERVMGNETT